MKPTKSIADDFIAARQALPEDLRQPDITLAEAIQTMNARIAARGQVCNDLRADISKMAARQESQRREAENRRRVQLGFDQARLRDIRHAAAQILELFNTMELFTTIALRDLSDEDSRRLGGMSIVLRSRAGELVREIQNTTTQVIGDSLD
jgi:hypothetical protein